MKILVLETNEKGKKVTEMLLKEKYYNLAIMFHPDHIFTALKNEVFHVIFIPLEICGLDSSELCRKINTLYPKIILHAYSDQCEFFNPDTMKRIGFDGLMNKPLRKKHVLLKWKKRFADGWAPVAGLKPIKNI